MLVTQAVRSRLCTIVELATELEHGPRRAGNRHLALETLGFSVVHRTPRVVRRDPGGFTDGIAAWLAARAARILG